MIDIGGPAMLRAAAKNFAYVTPVCRARGLRARARRAPRGAARPRSRRAGGSPRSRSRRRRRTRRRSRAGSSETRRFPETLVARLRQGARPLVRREPAPASRVLRRARRRTHLLSPRRAAAGEAALVQQPERPLRRAPARARVRRAGVRDRQAREPVRRRRRRRRSRRRTRGRSPPIPSRPTAASSSLNRAVTAALGEALAEQFVEVLFAPGYDEQALEALARKTSIRVLNDTERRALDRCRARLPARARRAPRPGRATGRSPSATAWRSSAAQVPDEQWDDLALRLAGREARDLERDRARAAAGRRSGSAPGR